MRFLRKNNTHKTVLVISDLHLGAGQYINGRRNFLEDFHFDQELVQFLNFYSKLDRPPREMELIINGDFLDFLAVSHIPFHDDEFWSEKAALAKLELVYKAHSEVFGALDEFLAKDRKIIYIFGNHDAEMIFPEVQKKFLSYFSNEKLPYLKLMEEGEDYSPHEGILIQHGHDYETPHQFETEKNLIRSKTGELYFNPPWGSYYVTRVVNKFKAERSFINSVRPIKSFLIYGLLFDTFFTLRFIFSNLYYYFMVRFLYFIKGGGNLKKIFVDIVEELSLFEDYQSLTKGFLDENPDIKVLLVGHSHDPAIHTYADGRVFINTGTWT